jgi:hypothetical protein
MGGKLLGAGGGGFLLVMAPPERHEAIREAVGRPREIPFRIDRRGSRVILHLGPLRILTAPLAHGARTANRDRKA